jgi:hypothetical protein
MHAERKDRRGDLIPVIVAVFVAVVGQAVILFNDFGPDNNSQGSRSATMITAAAVSRAGAIETKSVLRDHWATPIEAVVHSRLHQINHVG